MKQVKITKLKESDNPLHPNNISEGFFISGLLLKEPTIGEAFYVGYGWRTSAVKEIIDENTFRTYNSIYHWELIIVQE